MTRKRDKPTWADRRRWRLGTNVGINNTTRSMVLHVRDGVLRPADTDTAGQSLAARASHVGFGTACPAAQLHIG
jgi:hypothetical protein